ncbi:MAG: type II toxin-antitoxin system HicB family antitoxin [Parcubacteria group bacterium]|nr:type II toxin-antitoxin system HicB family antitoxin [Parcubacteria group bacterium]MBI3074705.1 type II toxin-antitoxin system HicB family antitoxin [Parcubacteria group bacterium]
MKYLTTLNKNEYGYSVSVPALPGCHSQGKTKKEALENIQDAILTYFAISREELEKTEVSEVEVAFPA